MSPRVRRCCSPNTPTRRRSGVRDPQCPRIEVLDGVIEEPIGSVVECDDTRAFRQEALECAATDAGGSPSDNCNLTGEAFVHRLSLDVAARHFEVSPSS